MQGEYGDIRSIRSTPTVFHHNPCNGRGLSSGTDVYTHLFQFRLNLSGITERFYSMASFRACVSIHEAESEAHRRILSFANALLAKLRQLGKRGYALREPTRGYSVVVEAERGKPSLLIKAHRSIESLVQVTYRDCPAVSSHDCGSAVRVEDAARIAEVMYGIDNADPFSISADGGRLERRNLHPF
jgi:hypothetical protein